MNLEEIKQSKIEWLKKEFETRRLAPASTAQGTFLWDEDTQYNIAMTMNSLYGKEGAKSNWQTVDGQTVQMSWNDFNTLTWIADNREVQLKKKLDKLVEVVETSDTPEELQHITWGMWEDELLPSKHETNFIWRPNERIEEQRNSYNGFSTRVYKRYHNQNMEFIEQRFKKIYGLQPHTPARAVNSCMGALSMLLFLHKDKKFLVQKTLYCEFWWIFEHFDNITTEDTNDYGYVICEPLSNPMLEKTDIKAICDKAHKIGAKVVVDNSLLTCYNYNPFKDGADIVIESIGKWVDGHGDVMAGILIGEDIEFISSVFACFLQPHEAYLAMRSLNTLPLRMDRHRENAKKVYQYLKTLTDNIIWDERIGIITCVFGSRELHRAIAKYCHLCCFEWVFGQVNTIIEPNMQRKGENFPEPYCKGYVRFSIGLENPDDIIADIKQAYTQAKWVKHIK